MIKGYKYEPQGNQNSVYFGKTLQSRTVFVVETHCLEGGKIAGETISKAIDTQDFSAELLSEYETGWKETFGKKIKRNYMVKEIILNMEDKTLNMLADSIKDVKFEEISTLGLVKALVLKHPTLLMKLRPLIKVSKEVSE